mmetsp:Transcript_5601/g.14184  ORF Transcript_5601/g.14184 Transcript_5601/m.14184 type:complete len:217 (+) Transcript_5601:1005-1655(+)
MTSWSEVRERPSMEEESEVDEVSEARRALANIPEGSPDLEMPSMGLRSTTHAVMLSCPPRTRASSMISLEEASMLLARVTIVHAAWDDMASHTPSEARMTKSSPGVISWKVISGSDDTMGFILRSPKEREIARVPLTREMPFAFTITLPPAASMRCFSFFLLGLWSSERSWQCPSLHSTVRESPRLAQKSWLSLTRIIVHTAPSSHPSASETFRSA